MAESSTSSLTSTSHTLTIGPSMASGSFPSLSDISSALAFRDAIRRSNRQAFLKPSATLPTATTQFAQVALGAFAGQVSDEQQERLRLRHAANAALKKRKRGRKDTAEGQAAALTNAAGPVGPILKVRRVHVDGFEVPQIWQQSNRILSASLSQAKHELEQLDKEDAKVADANGVSPDSDAEDDASDSDEGPAVNNQYDEDELEEDEDEEEEEDDEDEDLIAALDEDEEGDEDENEEEDEDEDEEDFNQRDLVEDENGLNDGFFDIDDFNKKSQFFEDEDARANPNTDQASDDEDFDWHGDPFAVADRSGKKRKSGKGADKSQQKDGREQLYSDDEDEDEDEGDGPVFGDMDLDAPSGESDTELDDEDGGLESGLNMDLGGEEIYYKDFFAPPPKKRKEGEPYQRPQAPARPFQPEDQDVRRAMADVRRDLFEQISEGEGSDEEDALSDVSEGNPRSRRSAHERRQAKILSEIRRLEAEAVREKDWTLSGEASAGARPMNSLLEEDLEFEHIGKPVPVITQEVTEDIEEMTKRRILSQEFDEVKRRYATGLGGDGGDAARRGLVEIDDKQGKKSLAALYEEEHLQSANPDSYISQSDEQLQAEEREVERMWKEVSAKLDALSSWHYKPRPAAPTLTVVADVGTVAMEDAQPATAQGVSGGSSMLAPQEVYKPGAAGAVGRSGGGADDKDVVTVAKTGLPVARDELSREDKARRRRRNKERIRKSGSGAGGAAATAATEAAAAAANGGSQTAPQKRQDTMAALKKGNVRVIGRRGKIENLDGSKPQVAQTVSSGNFKL